MWMVLKLKQALNNGDDVLIATIFAHLFSICCDDYVSLCYVRFRVSSSLIFVHHLPLWILIIIILSIK